ncbi:MAG: rRNA pseudouridine synthase [Thermotogae bacterium]|nr:rRNA pseudouridine synthase [Thermotogota bacterium]
MNLLQYLQREYGFSRRKAFRLIRKGKVKVGGKVVTQPLHPILDEKVEVEGYEPGGMKSVFYVTFHKPPGLVVSRSDPHNPTIYTILPPEFMNLRAVGRLDKYSEGLLLLTNDGLLIHRLTHPKYAVPRGYLVKVSPFPDAEVTDAVKRGIKDRGELLKAHESRILPNGWLYLVLKQGKYREIRRMMQHLGRKVKVLKRTFYGSIRLDVPKGSWRYLSLKEVEELKRMVGL